MDSKNRRIYIEKQLIDCKRPVKGQELAKNLGVTRQIIVKDIAILRAEGKEIIATPEGYILSPRDSKKIQKIIALCHKTDEIKEELDCVVMFGGTIKDVIIEHPVYGEIRGMLMLKTPYDVQNFITNFNNHKAEPLSSLTGGVHLHTIEADSNEILDRVCKELKNKGFLISD